jgi:flagellin
VALNIVSNYAANVATRYLAKADAAASASLAKLSAGTRVLSAKDDAASLAIGSRLNAEVQAQKQAKVNAGQATSMLQIADGAMSKVNDILVRMKTLAVQSGSGQLSGTERGMLDTEYQALTSEIDRISKDTEFNGTSLVNGSSKTETIPNSANSGNKLDAAHGFASIKLGNDVGNAVVTVAYDATTDVMTVKNTTTGESQGVAIGSSAIATNETQTVNFDQLGIVIDLNAAFDKTANIVIPANTYVSGGGVGAVDLNSVKISDVDEASWDALNTYDGEIYLQLGVASAAGVGIYQGAAYFTASADMTATGAQSLTLTSTNGDSFVLDFTITTGFGTSSFTSTLTIGGLGNQVLGAETTSDTTDFTFKLGTGTTANVDEVTIGVGSISAESLGIDGQTVLTKAAADTASTAISSAIDTLSKARANVGAAQNRLEFASDNLASTIENTEAARSSLMDLDVASEMTAFTAKQVLVQSGVAMLAQANNMPQNLLKLFQ